MTKEVLEVGGKRCKFGAIEIERISNLIISSHIEVVSGNLSHGTQVPRVFRCDATAYDSAEQLIYDP